jgi:hypothetical protein
MECLNPGLDIFKKRDYQTSIVNTYTVSHKPIAPADNPAQLEFNCSGSSDRYTILNSVKLDLLLKLVKTNGTDIVPADANKTGCVNNLMHSMFTSLNIALNGKTITLYEAHYYMKAFIQKTLNFGFDAYRTHVQSSLFYLDTPGTDGKLAAVTVNTGYESRLKFLNNSQTTTFWKTSRRFDLLLNVLTGR